LVLFGGYNNGGGYFSDTWEWNGTNWLGRSPLNSPGPRYGHAMAYDAVRQRVVLFGGFNGAEIGDTWEWNGTNWTQLLPVASPSTRYDHAMAYHAVSQRVVLFGGQRNGSPVGETWEWDGTNWTLLPSASPSARHSHAMAHDAARQRVVLFGGVGVSYLGDTWEWNGTNWLAQFSLNYPSPRYRHAMAYDEMGQRVVLFGGSSSSTSYLSDTWEWNGTNWVQLSPTASPSARYGHAMAYHAAGQRVVLFGGAGSLGDTWINGLPTTPAFATAYGAGCGSPALGFVPDTNGRPLLGQTASATIVDAPTPVAAVAIGWSSEFFGPFALPVTLAGIGMPGCDLLQSADILGLGTAPLTPSTLSYSLAIPNAPSLIGLHLYLQAYAFAPGVNPLQFIISNGIDWLLGNV